MKERRGQLHRDMMWAEMLCLVITHSKRRHTGDSSRNKINLYWESTLTIHLEVSHFTAVALAMDGSRSPLRLKYSGHARWETTALLGLLFLKPDSSIYDLNEPLTRYQPSSNSTFRYRSGIFAYLHFSNFTGEARNYLCIKQNA